MQSAQKNATGAANQTKNKRPSREEAEAAVRTLLLWAGENPDREGLVNTPKRVVTAYEEMLAEWSDYRKFPESLTSMQNVCKLRKA